MGRKHFKIFLMMFLFSIPGRRRSDRESREERTQGKAGEATRLTFELKKNNENMSLCTELSFCFLVSQGKRGKAGSRGLRGVRGEKVSSSLDSRCGPNVCLQTVVMVLVLVDRLYSWSWCLFAD